jgi:hypothetical protein
MFYDLGVEPAPERRPTVTQESRRWRLRRRKRCLKSSGLAAGFGRGFDSRRLHSEAIVFFDKRLRAAPALVGRGCEMLVCKT